MKNNTLLLLAAICIFFISCSGGGISFETGSYQMISYKNLKSDKILSSDCDQSLILHFTTERNIMEGMPEGSKVLKVDNPKACDLTIHGETSNYKTAYIITGSKVHITGFSYTGGFETGHYKVSEEEGTWILTMIDRWEMRLKKI